MGRLVPVSALLLALREDGSPDLGEVRQQLDVPELLQEAAGSERYGDVPVSVDTDAVS